MRAFKATASGLLMASLASVLSAQSPGLVAQPGAVVVEPPTTGALGVEWRIHGDDNRNASVALAWRRTGETAWRDGLPLMRLQGEAVLHGASFQYVAPNMFAGSVFDLAPDTSYDIRLRLTDPDAPAGSAPVERTVTGRTRPVPKPASGGAVYHVYPRDYTGPRLQPSSTSLMAAYNTGPDRTVAHLHPASVIAEWWRGRTAVREDILAASRIVASLRAAQAAGVALGKMRDVDASLTIDAIVMATAALAGAMVVTADPDDFLRLAAHFPRVTVLSA